MKRNFLSLVLFLSSIFGVAQSSSKAEHNAFVQGYVQSIGCEQVKLNSGKLEMYHRRSFLLAALLGLGAVSGTGVAVLPWLALRNSFEEVCIKGFAGVVGGATAALSVYKLMQMYSSTPLVVFSSEGFYISGRSMIKWDDVADVFITESVEKVSSGNTFNNNGFISASIGSEKMIVTYGVAVKNKYGQTVYQEIENVLPVEVTSFCTIFESYWLAYRTQAQ